MAFMEWDMALGVLMASVQDAESMLRVQTSESELKPYEIDLHITSSSQYTMELT